MQSQETSPRTVSFLLPGDRASLGVLIDIFNCGHYSHACDSKVQIFYFLTPSPGYSLTASSQSLGGYMLPGLNLSWKHLRLSQV